MATTIILSALCITGIYGFAGVNWTLLAHGSDRFVFDSSSSDFKAWKSVSAQPLHLINWESPFDDAIQPIQAGSVFHRPSDGFIHVMLAGNDSVHLGAEWPGGGSDKAYGPPMIWEIDPKTGDTNYIYDLSQYGKAFYSLVRYTPTGDLIVAVCNGNSPSLIKILIIDQTTHKVKFQYTSTMEPMLLQVSNTSPQMLLYAGMYSDGYLNFTQDGSNIAANDKEIVNGGISSIIFGADGQTIYNNGFFNEAVGIYRLKLPFTSSEKPDDFVPGCDTLPWMMASDTNGNMFAVCSSSPYSITKYDSSGKSVWKSEVNQVSGYTYPYIMLDDTEKYIIFGTNKEWVTFDADTGDLKWAKSLSDIAQKRDQGLVCYNSAQPWANRHPVPMPNGELVILCRTTNNGYDIRSIDIETGSLSRDSTNVAFNVSIVSADSNAVYLWGYNDAERHIVGQRIPM